MIVTRISQNGRMRHVVLDMISAEDCAVIDVTDVRPCGVVSERTAVSQQIGCSRSQRPRPVSQPHGSPSIATFRPSRRLGLRNLVHQNDSAEYAPADDKAASFARFGGCSAESD